MYVRGFEAATEIALNDLSVMPLPSMALPCVGTTVFLRSRQYRTEAQAGKFV